MFVHVQVPPYARAGLYKQLSTLKDLVREFREDTVKNASLRPAIAAQLEQTGLFEDLPYRQGKAGNEDGVLTAEAVEEMEVEGKVSVSFAIASYRRVLCTDDGRPDCMAARFEGEMGKEAG